MSIETAIEDWEQAAKALMKSVQAEFPVGRKLHIKIRKNSRAKAQPVEVLTHSQSLDAPLVIHGINLDNNKPIRFLPDDEYIVENE